MREGCEVPIHAQVDPIAGTALPRCEGETFNNIQTFASEKW